MIEFAKKQKVTKVYIHAFLDGRDTPPRSAEKFIQSTEKFCKEIGDRDDIWYIGGTLYLGHDLGQYKIDINWLEERRFKLSGNLSKPSMSHTLEENLMNS